MKNVIFDFGNVLIRWRPYAALNGYFSTEAEMLTCFEQIDFFGWNAEQDRGRSWEDGLAIAARDYPEHAHIFHAYSNGLDAAHGERVPGMSDLVEALHRRGVGLFGLTNAAEASFQAVKRTAPEIGYMRDVVVSSREGLIKPSPEIFEMCLSRNGIQASDALFVDDSAGNCRGAEAMGIRAHLFTDAATLQADLRALGLL
ncbi:HAD family phosphatase [Ruegeria sp. 2012CJ41-6]|uniref:HAD family phosphatase n=1 Tax=Ruegeria spongiae TaxID=2942209 RepID=A0ABT0Q0J9_9RHOB|nr:HAD family phosphatase [Ruegeria spongiae]MCL6283308.1 HAD family phosphatase [Ruegeria spongiae]